LPDDYITDVQWWHRDDLFGKPNVAASLQQETFWNMLEVPEYRAGYLGRRTD